MRAWHFHLRGSLAGVLLLLAVQGLLALQGQAQNAPPPAVKKLTLKAALVLTPEFCATVNKKGSEKFKVGEETCAQLEPALDGVFEKLTRVDDTSKAGDAQLVLEPRFADVGATQKAFAFSNRELVVLVEWTVRDATGKAIWIETVQGSAQRHIGNAFTYNSNLKHIIEDSVHDMANQSAAKMAAEPALVKLSEAPVK